MLTHVQPLKVWLESVGLHDGFLCRTLLEHGYEDTTFCVGLTMEDLENIGVLHTLDGRAHANKILQAVAKLPRDHLPESIPPTLEEWLRLIRLEFYYPNFKYCGYDDIELLEFVTEEDLTVLGIKRQGHLNKCKAAVQKLSQLLFQGRSPEGGSVMLLTTLIGGTDPAMANLKDTVARDIVSKMKEASIQESILAVNYVFDDEASFWKQVR